MTREEPEILAEQGEGFPLRKIKRISTQEGFPQSESPLLIISTANKVKELQRWQKWDQNSGLQSPWSFSSTALYMAGVENDSQQREISVEARDRKNKKNNTLNVRDMEGTRKLTPEHM